MQITITVEGHSSDLRMVTACWDYMLKLLRMVFPQVPKCDDCRSLQWQQIPKDPSFLTILPFDTSDNGAILSS